MVSPVPKFLITDSDSIPSRFCDHVDDLSVDASRGVRIDGAGYHRAKFAPGLSTALLDLAGTLNVGDPMAGTGMLAYETGMSCKLNDIDLGMSRFLSPLETRGCTVTYGPADEVGWKCDTLIFSPPYYPRTDRRRPCAHDDKKRGPVVGFRDSYSCNHPKFIGNPGGVNAIKSYRAQMLGVYAHLLTVGKRMIVVVKNWMRLGVEMRLDWDTILMAESVGWRCVERHGFTPPPSLWSRFNAARGERQGRNGMVQIEDVLIFQRTR